MGRMKEPDIVRLDDEQTKLEQKLRIPLFVENLQRTNTDRRSIYPRPYVRKGTGPKVFLSANALNRDHGTKLPDFVFYNKACDSTKKLITKHGYESIFHDANSYQTQLLLDTTNRLSPEVENFPSREDTLEQLLNLKFVATLALPSFIRSLCSNPIYNEESKPYRSISSASSKP